MVFLHYLPTDNAVAFPLDYVESSKPKTKQSEKQPWKKRELTSGKVFSWTKFPGCARQKQHWNERERPLLAPLGISKMPMTILPQFPPPAFVNFPFHRHVGISLFPLERVNKWIGYQMLWGFLSFSSHILRIWVRFLPFLSASLQILSMLEKRWYSVIFVLYTIEISVDS